MKLFAFSVFYLLATLAASGLSMTTVTSSAAASTEGWPFSVFAKNAKDKKENAAKARARKGKARRNRVNRTRTRAGEKNSATAAVKSPSSTTAVAVAPASKPSQSALASIKAFRNPTGDNETAAPPADNRPETRPPAELPGAEKQADKQQVAEKKPRQPVKSWQWRITKTHWSRSDEAGFEEFVQKIGESKCGSMNSCLKSAKANPAFYKSNPRGMFFYADCADLPYMLRSYYAWKNGLPFSYSTEVSPLGRSRDIRYTLRGNKVTKRLDLVQTPLDARRVLPRIMNISSAHYRIPPLLKSKLPTDHYSVAINRKSIKPGTIVYDPNGHVIVVYKVTPEGRIRYIDTHPDNSLTRGTYGRKFQRARPSMGAGFKRWRPLRLVGATRLASGNYRGGHIVHAKDEGIPDWSVEQFYGTNATPIKSWRKGKFTARGKNVNYYDFVRLRLAAANFRFNPIEETRAMMQALCADIRYRADAVNLSIEAGLQKRPQPDRLPRNIYGTDGDWEIYSTPSRDARLKTSFKELRDEVARFIKLSDAGSKQINYAGSNLKRDLLNTYNAEASACKISYKSSKGVAKSLNYDDIAGRLFSLSFDPYHCVERRWGATSKEELASCPDGAAKRNWYTAEQRLRNQIDRKYDLRMDFYLAGLRSKKPGSGVDTPPDIDVRLLLKEPGKLATIAAPDSEPGATR